MNPTAAAAAVLARLADARRVWLDAAREVLAAHRFVDAVWVEGSLGRGDADALSDIDLVVAVGESASGEVFADPVSRLGLPGSLLYVRDKPKNAPAGGSYRAVCVEMVTLPVLVDLYLWQAATAAMSATARLLYRRGDDRPPRSDLGFLPLIGRYPGADTRGSDPDQPQTALMLVQLAAKYLARGDHERETAIRRQLRDPAGAGDTAALRRILTARVNTEVPSSLAAAVAAAHRLIDVVEHLAGSACPNRYRSTTTETTAATTTEKGRHRDGRRRDLDRGAPLAGAARRAARLRPGPGHVHGARGDGADADPPVPGPLRPVREGVTAG